MHYVHSEVILQLALVLAEKFGMRELTADCHWNLGILYEEMGRSKQAHAELSTAIKIFKALDIPDTDYRVRACIESLSELSRGKTD
jgi:hypothetical protein